VFAGPAFHPSTESPSPIAPPRVIDDSEFGELYADNVRLLVAIAVRKFQVPEVDAEALAHEVFLSYLKRKNEIRELHPWLIGAICHASRYFWRQNGHRTDQLDQELATLRPDPASMEIVDVLPSQLAVREILELLPPRYQEILRLRYFEGFTIREIADYLGVTAKYTQKLVGKCLRLAEQTFNARARNKR
jgi:RNA polymerase sigma factor (sigma-70 family)